MASKNTDNRSVEAESQYTDEACPECGGCVRTAGHEIVCHACGLVLVDEIIDHGPEWRAITDETTTTRRRVGAPNTVARHDRGIGTQIGYTATSLSEGISGRKRRQLARLRREHARAKIGSKAERNRIDGLTEIRRMVSALGFGDQTRDQACQLFRTAQNQDLLPGRSIEAIAAGCVYAVCRINSHPRGMPEVASVAKIQQDRIENGYQVLNQELALPVPPPDPRQYLRQIATRIDIADRTIRAARDCLTHADDELTAHGKNPRGTAAGALYLASEQTNHDITQEDLAATANVSALTVRNRYYDLKDAHPDE